MTKKKTEIPATVQEYIDNMGKFLAEFSGLPNQAYIKGKVYIFLGIHKADGGKEVISIPGTKANSKFKEKVCEAAMDLLLEDSSIHLPKTEDEKE